MKQYDIVLVNLDPTLGAEIKKTRPCVIISPNEMNRNLRTLIVAPMTTQSRKYPSRIEVRHGDKNGWVVLDQIRTIDRRRVVNQLDKLNRKEIKAVKAILEEMLVK